MPEFLSYNLKVACLVTVFYVFYRVLLCMETFHKLNRAVLLGTSVISFILPLVHITLRRRIMVLDIAADCDGQMPLTFGYGGEFPAEDIFPPASPIQDSLPLWQTVMASVYLIGVIFVLSKVIISIISTNRIIRGGEVVSKENGISTILTDRVSVPFNWMKYVVIPRSDWEKDSKAIILHEKAHCALHHSADILVVDIISAFLWYNPAIWMLRSDLRDIHEFQADETALMQGISIKEYQMLLIRKAAKTAGYSITNNFSHNSIKKRIAMIGRKRSPVRAVWKAAFIIPILVLSILANSRIDYVKAQTTTPSGGAPSRTAESSGRRISP